MKVVFLIDDDCDDREIFQECLGSLQRAVKYQEAENGKEAFEKLKSDGFQKPDIIFLDLKMPGMDGRAFLKAIKQDEALKNIPVIIYSTSSSDADKTFAASHGAAAFITKPYLIGAIRQQLHTAVITFLHS